jgi:hypothetical protein
MFFLPVTLMWTVSVFFLYFYLFTSFFLFLYLFANNTDLRNYTSFYSKQEPVFLQFKDVLPINLTLLFLAVTTFTNWNGPTLTIWFGHFFVSFFQIKFIYLIFWFFGLFLIFLTFSIYLNTKASFDFVIIVYHFLYWTTFIFFANTIFSVIFFIEVLSTLIFLLFITSTFSSIFFYNNLNLNLSNYFNQQTPFFLINSLIFFFWISLLASLGLFLFLLLFYFKFMSFDWFLNEFLLYYFFSSQPSFQLYLIFFIWFFFIFAIFLKCGLTPFYFWKPYVFKSISLPALAFYILFFYFFIFLFFILLLINYFNEIFYFYLLINIFSLLVGFLIILMILTEAYYFKAFLAISSILNTLFVFLILNSINTTLLFI